MRYAEIEKGRVRFVLPAVLAGNYTVLPPNAVEIAPDSDMQAGDVYDQAVAAAADRVVFDEERARLFDQSEWARQRHSDRVDLGIDDAVNWTAWLNYWQALRDLPDSEGFNAGSPVWPLKPV